MANLKQIGTILEFERYLINGILIKINNGFSQGARTLSITTFSIMTLSIRSFYVTLSISDSQHKQHSA
jgi:hypothetical protein